MSLAIMSKRHKPQRHLGDSTPYRPLMSIAFTFSSKPIAPVHIVMVDDLELDYVGSRGFAVFAPTKDAVFHLNRLDEQNTIWPLAMLTFKATQNRHIVISGSVLQVNVGDVLQLIPPQNQDATLADVSITLRSTRV